MAKDIYAINIEFLKNKGLELQPTGAMFTPFAFDNDEYSLSVGEWSNISIHNLKTGKRKTVSLVYELLTDDDF
tara:strand:- start:35338 stop:35556 length:219 start_codon:yes stop_codon:yes gene_type:complete